MNRWLFDLGNSRLKYAPLLDGGQVGAIANIAHADGRFADDWTASLPAHIDIAYVASVAASDLRVALLDVIARRAGVISIARTQPAFAGVRIAYAQPQRLGVDRFLALLAARVHGAQATLVVGVGTALTIDLLDAHGQHLGGRIAPSPTLMRDALHARAAQLPAAGGEFHEFASDTAGALASGCLGAALGLIERSHAWAASQLAVPPRLLMHGGGAPALLQHLPDALHAPALVLEGLARWADAQP